MSLEANRWSESTRVCDEESLTAALASMTVNSSEDSQQISRKRKRSPVRGTSRIDVRCVGLLAAIYPLGERDLQNDDGWLIELIDKVALQTLHRCNEINIK